MREVTSRSDLPSRATFDRFCLKKNAYIDHYARIFFKQKQSNLAPA